MLVVKYTLAIYMYVHVAVCLKLQATNNDHSGARAAMYECIMATSFMNRMHYNGLQSCDIYLYDLGVMKPNVMMA